MVGRLSFITLLGLCIILHQSASFPQTVDLITNGNFSSGLSNWIPWSWMVNASGGSLNWDNRPAGTTTTGNAIGATQTLNESTAPYDWIVLMLDVKPVFQSLASPGAFAGGIEYPVHLEIDYTDYGDNSRDFQHGFYYSGHGGGAVPGTYVPQDSWHTYTSPDLLSLIDKPKTIDKVHIYGNGWNYAGSADNIQLLAHVVPEPASMFLFSLGIFGFGIFRRKSNIYKS